MIIRGNKSALSATNSVLSALDPQYILVAGSEVQYSYSGEVTKTSLGVVRKLVYDIWEAPGARFGNLYVATLKRVERMPSHAVPVSDYALGIGTTVREYKDDTVGDIVGTVGFIGYKKLSTNADILAKLDEIDEKIGYAITKTDEL